MEKFSAKFGEFPFTVHYIKESSEAETALRLLLNSNAKVLGVDIETSKRSQYLNHPKAGLDPYLSDIRLIQLYDGEKVYVLDRFYIGQSCDFLLIKLFKEKRLVAHNALFELKFFRYAGMHPSNIDCSMLLAMLVLGAEFSPFEKDDDDDEEETGLSKYRQGVGLEACTARLFGIKIDKFFQTSNWNAAVLSKEQIQYAALDAVLTLEVAKALSPKLNTYKMAAAYKLLRESQHAISTMELNGMLIDPKQHDKLIDTWSREVETASAACSKLITVNNLNSSVQLGKWARDTFSKDVIKAWPVTPSGHLSFKKSNLGFISSNKAIKALLEYKHYNKLLTTYGQSMRDHVNPVTKRIHTSFNLGGTRTGRLSSRDPNLQNLPRDAEVRKLFIAPEGSKLVVADFSQIEMRVAGELSKDKVILAAYAKGLDLHRLMAADLTHKSLGQVTKEDRQLAKAVNFGLLFGMGANKLISYAKDSYNVTMSLEEATHAVDIFRKKYSTYRTWCYKQRDLAAKKGFTRTPCGKMRKLMEEEIYTKAVNTPVQGGAAEVTLKALCHLNGKGKLLNTVHDEIIMECAEDYIDRTKDVLEVSMTKGMKDIFPNACVRGLVEAVAGQSWGECKGG